MIQEKMTVHQALCELKVLNKRIIRAISETIPVAAKEHGSANVNGKPVAQFEDLARSTHASAVDLIRRQCAIKSAVSQYNASRVITVCGKEYTIAQAIWMMNYGMDNRRSLLDTYTNMLRRVTAEIERKNGEDLNRRAEAAMNALYGSKDKANHDDYLNGEAEYKRLHAMEIVDPLGITKIISDLEKEIADFESGVDAAIQVANATTEIEISY